MALAGAGLLAVWLDPAEPARYREATYTLLAIYVVYSIALTAVVWNRSSAGRLPLVTHLIDIVLFSVFQQLTLGPSSPFVAYFIFSLFCGTLRWQWRGTVGTALLIVPLFLGVGATIDRKSVV